MTAKKPISVILGADVLEELQRVVREGQVPSCSAMTNDALCSRVERRRQARCARACIEENFLAGAALSEEEMIRARGMLAANKARTAARRTDGTSAV